MSDKHADPEFNELLLRGMIDEWLCDEPDTWLDSASFRWTSDYEYNTVNDGNPISPLAKVRGSQDGELTRWIAAANPHTLNHLLKELDRLREVEDGLDPTDTMGYHMRLRATAQD